jgi:predicted anti-sigma-YlaC factor YlaD
MFTQLTRITCQRANVLLSQQMDAPLGALDRYRLLAHLKACTACRRVDEQFRLISRAMKRLGD